MIEIREREWGVGAWRESLERSGGTWSIHCQYQGSLGATGCESVILGTKGNVEKRQGGRLNLVAALAWVKSKESWLLLNPDFWSCLLANPGLAGEVLGPDSSAATATWEQTMRTDILGSFLGVRGVVGVLAGPPPDFTGSAPSQPAGLDSACPGCPPVTSTEPSIQLLPCSQFCLSLPHLRHSIASFTLPTLDSALFPPYHYRQVPLISPVLIFG
jgi:hypothetical protein